MNKKEIRCKHRHTADEHPQCFMGGKLIDNAQWWKSIRTGYLDIETTQFTANYGYMLSWAIKDRNTGKIYSDSITKDDLFSGVIDKRIVKSLLKTMERFDCLVTYYGTKFDIPFIRTRSFVHRLGFFNMGQIKHIDLYYTTRSKLRMQRNSLEAACALFGIHGKNHVDPALWIAASLGDKKALAYVLDHNERDVDILQELHNNLETQAGFPKRSI